ECGLDSEIISIKLEKLVLTMGHIILSHNYVFNVAQFIEQEFFKKLLNHNSNISQIFVMTHNLYFFHELDKLVVNLNSNIKDKASKLTSAKFRITKTKDGTKIDSVANNEILNDYQSYWQIIKNNKRYDNGWLVANSMRNILEYFFGFVFKRKIKYLTKLNEKEYAWFLRYMDRESHSDEININDMKDIDIKIFLQAFNKVFKENGYEDHYNIMMGFKEDKSEV
ncbi:MAG: AAA family ATPase, partial [Burkholderiales bacterium]|nr:AAA family ATPase [Burkholderiales bacterium]